MLLFCGVRDVKIKISGEVPGNCKHSHLRVLQAMCYWNGMEKAHVAAHHSYCGHIQPWLRQIPNLPRLYNSYVTGLQFLELKERSESAILGDLM